MIPPSTVFTGNPLARASDRRNDPEWIAEKESDDRAQAMVLWEGRPLLEEGPEGPRLVWLSMPHAMDLTRDRRAFLGLWKDDPVFAVEFEGAGDPAAGPVRGLGAFHEMREAAALLPGPEAAMAGAAKALFDWRRRHGFCAACGTETRDSGGGWRRTCPACRTEHFPRVDPVVIMLPIHGDRCLLGRQASWPARRMSALAGFLEPGESIEEACAREVAEEAGLEVTAVRYRFSQPWPFPSQLMIGLECEVSHDRAAPDQTELEAVAWLTRAEARAALAGDHPQVLAPPSIAIARDLLKAWAESAD